MVAPLPVSFDRLPLSRPLIVMLLMLMMRGTLLTLSKNEARSW